MKNPQPGPIEAFQGQVRALLQKEGLVQRSFVHPSYANERNLEPQESYERLEYLGDALLTAVVSEYLFLHFGRLNEGALTMIRAGLVNEGSLAGLARALGLDRLVLLGKGEERSGGRQKPSILCDVFEALVGALFLELGYDKLKICFYHCSMRRPKRSFLWPRRRTKSPSFKSLPMPFARKPPSIKRRKRAESSLSGCS